MRKNSSKGGGKPAKNLGAGVQPKIKKVKAKMKAKRKKSSGGRY